MLKPVKNGQKFQMNLNPIMMKENLKELLNMDFVRNVEEILERCFRSSFHVVCQVVD